MSRQRRGMFRSIAVTLAVFAAASINKSALAQSSTPTSPSDTTQTASPTADTSAKTTASGSHHSRFGKWGKAFGHAAAKVGKATGIDKKTAERVAATVVMGGAGAALMNSRAASTVPGVAGAAAGLEQQATLLAIPATPDTATKTAAADSAARTKTRKPRAS